LLSDAAQSESILNDYMSKGAYCYNVVKGLDQPPSSPSGCFPACRSGSRQAYNRPAHSATCSPSTDATDASP
jgi:hypothetical protein